METNKHTYEEGKFYKGFINSLLKDELIFLCNGKDKLKELKNSLSEIGIKKSSDIETIYEKESKKVGQIIDKFYFYSNAFFQELLKINNLSFLTGAGTSIPFGSESIRDISKLKIDLSGNLKKLYNNMKDLFLGTNESKDFESFLGFLFNILTLLPYKNALFEFKIADVENIRNLISEIKKQFVKKYCSPPYSDKMIEGYKKDNPFEIHQRLIRKILVRSFPLRRPNIFTLNYDLMFEKAMDKMGIVYADGFVGTSERIFKPESFNFDFYYPATTTEGKVNRLEKVIHLYKLHGSIDWVKVQRTPYNIMGIVKKSPEVLEEGEFLDLLVYPSPMKEGETVGFPYSEVFRRFADVIQQPQSVLIALGYSFGDEHINRIIYESFSMPSFNLVIVGYTKKSIEEVRTKIGDDERVTYIGGKSFGDFKYFAERILPSVSQMELEERIIKTLKRLLPDEREKEEGISKGGDNNER